jgi:hypothetical protein
MVMLTLPSLRPQPAGAVPGWTSGRATAMAHLTSAAPRSSARYEAAQAGSASARPERVISRKGRKCHACCPLLPRSSRVHLDRAHVTPRASGGGRPGRRRFPGHPAARADGRAAKGSGGNKRPRNSVRQRLGSLGGQLVHAPPWAPLILHRASRVPGRAPRADPAATSSPHPCRPAARRGPSARTRLTRLARLAGPSGTGPARRGRPAAPQAASLTGKFRSPGK